VQRPSRFDDGHAVQRERRVAGDDGELVFERVGDEQAIERIAVMPGQAPNAERSGEPELGDFEPRATQHAGKPSLGRTRELELAEGLLDRDFPSRHDAHEDVVGPILNRGSRAGGQAPGIGRRLQNDMGIEQKLQGSAPSAAAMSAGKSSKSA